MTTQGTETRSAETTGSARKGDGPVPVGDAPDRPNATDYRNRAERAEAECKELRRDIEELKIFAMRIAEMLTDRMMAHKGS